MQPKCLPCARLVSLSFHQSILLYISTPLLFSISPSLPLFSISQSLTYFLYNLHHFIYFPVSTSLYHFSVISITIITLSFLYISISISISPYFSRYLFFSLYLHQSIFSISPSLSFSGCIDRPIVIPLSLSLLFIYFSFTLSKHVILFPILLSRVYSSSDGSSSVPVNSPCTSFSSPTCILMFIRHTPPYPPPPPPLLLSLSSAVLLSCFSLKFGD